MRHLDEMDKFENVEGEGDWVNPLPPRDITFEPLTISINSKGGHVGCCADIINSVAAFGLSPSYAKVISQLAEAERVYVHLGRAGRAAIQEFNVAVSAADFSTGVLIKPFPRRFNDNPTNHSLKRDHGWYHQFDKPNGKRNKTCPHKGQKF